MMTPILKTCFKKQTRFVTAVLLLSVSLTSCISFRTDYPRYDQVLTYDRPYDYTYLKALEALNTFPEWTLELTDKDEGLLILRNREYGHLFDRDKQVARIRVRRVSTHQTSVALDPDSQRIPKGGEFLKRINEFLSAAR
ncbi:MAG: hypothetical protein A3J52_00795 [Omnitrophica bacterium RIFCSPHIGHO2_02_FULL_49_9]|nr:MAG: hypothetical protein A3J52_00795 [Omnitrophica bacterium RIFCSPHIGHO2_02_FULL_49_9]OGW89885.1 MAG: hypothetical protein A3A73_00055 [Omnitrophica bacterium RIFCSPLOWO2_01_FULL_50_24]